MILTPVVRISMYFCIFVMIKVLWLNVTEEQEVFFLMQQRKNRHSSSVTLGRHHIFGIPPPRSGVETRICEHVLVAGGLLLNNTT